MFGLNVLYVTFALRLSRNRSSTQLMLMLLSLQEGSYMNWQNATTAFKSHEISSCHKETVPKLITLPATRRDVGESLSTALSKQNWHVS